MIAELPRMLHILGGCNMISIDSKEQLDQEWLELIKEALTQGITIEEIRNFLNK
jgi:hypothetical protein